jgi:hypothetical protein
MTPYTFDQRPDLREKMGAVAETVWPAFMLEDAYGARYWNALYKVFPEYQSTFLDGDGNVVANAFTVPFYWDGKLHTLPPGWDEVIAGGFADKAAGREPNTLSALAAEIVPGWQGKGLSAEPLKQMSRIAKAKGFTSLVAPVRPTMKAQYPNVPIEEYAYWTREDGLPFDPWMRVHARLGAEVIKVAPRAMYVPGTVAEWEEWTGMKFPVSGNYVVPNALQPVKIDREADLGEYYDPNVWMKHPV